MLRIYSVILQVVREVAPLAVVVGRADPDLARQLRRALASVPLNTAEGSYSRGANRSARYQNAAGSMREVLACLEVAQAMGYVLGIEPALHARVHHVFGTLVRVVRPGGQRHPPS